MNSFDIFGQIAKELESFRQDKIQIAGSGQNTDARYLGRNDKGYSFSQYQTVDLIELYYNSKFETGNIDSEGQRKLFLNICAFRADVAAKMIDLDTKDFTWIPNDNDSKWLSYFISRRFKSWARDSYFGELINDIVESFPRYGTVVVKKVGDKLERVPLKNLVNQQNAKDLATASHVIEIHEDVTIEDMKKYPDWNLDGVELEYGQTTTVYERYGLIPCETYYQMQGKKCPESERGEMKDCVVIATLSKTKDSKWKGNVLFCEEVSERPYLEVHWKRQDGRWLGIGEVENQFENQISRNMIANLRRRALLWSSKKVFQSPDDTLPKNLVRDVKDGDIIRIMPNGNITQVDMASREVGEFSSTEALWEKNSDQKSFTYEVATGEALPSGTPFRLGVVLSNAVNSHFGMKREKLGLFLKKLVEEFIYDIFKEENSDEHTITTFGTEKGMNDLRKVYAEIETNRRIVEWAMNDDVKGFIPDFTKMKEAIELEYQNQSHLFTKIPEDAYEQAENKLTLTITGEEVDVESEIASWTTVYQAMIQSGDPRAEQALEEIFKLKGKNLEATLGPKPQPVQTQAPQAPEVPQLPIPQQPQANPQQL